MTLLIWVCMAGLSLAFGSRAGTMQASNEDPVRRVAVGAPAVAGPHCPESLRVGMFNCIEASSIPSEGVLFPAPHDGGVDNVQSGLSSFVGGGYQNAAEVTRGAVGGGEGNQVLAGTPSATFGVVGGGRLNTVMGVEAGVVGGEGNSALGMGSTVVGGAGNLADDEHSFVLGGADNHAGSEYSFAGGFDASVPPEHTSSFVWGGATPGPHVSASSHSFTAYAENGVRFFTESETEPTLIVTPDGRVGVGTPDPSSRLHVRDRDIGVASGASQWEDVTVEDQLAVLGLHGTEGCRIRLTDVDGSGEVQDGWTFAVDYEDPGSYPWYDHHLEVWGPNGRLSMSEHGGVGLLPPSDTPFSYDLDCNGTAGKPGGGSWTNSSDQRLKRNVRRLDDALDTLLALRGVGFEYIDPEAIQELPGERIGMIAQDVEQVVPDWVDEGADGYKRTTFRGFEALTVEALRDLRGDRDFRLSPLLEENAELRARITALEAMVAELESLAAEGRGAGDPGEG